MPVTPASTSWSATACASSGRDRDDADVDALARDDGRHLVDRVAAAAVEDAAGLLGGPVEGGGEADRLPVGVVGQDGAAEIADADERRGGLDGPREDGVDRLHELLDGVAPAGAAGEADRHQVAADLGGGADGEAGELVGVDLPGADGELFLQQAPVEAQTADGVDRNARRRRIT